LREQVISGKMNTGAISIYPIGRRVVAPLCYVCHGSLWK
jgi:hypothetical protein